MKKLLLLLVPFLTLSSCSDSKKDDPSPAVVKTYRISVHVVGAQAAGTNVAITSTYDFAGGRTSRPGPTRAESFTTPAVDRTYDLGTFGDYDIVEVQMAGRSALAGNGYLKAEIIVDGVVKKSATMNTTTASRDYAAVETDDL
jgi:hypothetical protein